MIIVLKKADFSQSNIGKVDFITELTEETKVLMTRATKYPIVKENRYAQALNKLVSAMVEKGIFGKVTTLVIPAMSNSIAECSLNQLTGQANSNPSYFTTLYGLREDGSLFKTETVFSDEGTHCGHSISHTYNNMCVFGFYKSGGTGIDNIISAKINGWYGSSNYLKFIASGPAGQIGAAGSIALSSNKNPLANRSMPTSAFVVNYTANGITYQDKGIAVEASYQTLSKTAELIRLYPLIEGASSKASDGGLFIYGCGEGLSNEESSQMFTILNEFGNTFL